MKGYANENFRFKKKVGMLVLSSVCFCPSKVGAVDQKLWAWKPEASFQMKLNVACYSCSTNWSLEDMTVERGHQVLCSWPDFQVFTWIGETIICKNSSRSSPPFQSEDSTKTMMQNSSHVWYVGSLLATTQWIPPGKTHSFQPALVGTITSWASGTGTAPPVKAKLSKSKIHAS